MIETRSEGTGVFNLKLLAKFFKSFSLISLSFRSLVTRIFSTSALWRVAKFLKAVETSRSTVAVALGTALALAESVLAANAGVFIGVAFGSGVAEKLDSVVVGGVATSALEALGVGSGAGEVLL